MSRPHRFDPRSHATRGYTAIEVLMAMTVMAIGAAGVISMEKTSMQSNLDARKTDVANAIARTWVERIRRDAMQWTQPGPANQVAPPGNLALAKVLQQGVSNLGTWYLPNQYVGSNPPLSAGFDILGRDVPATSIADALFCTNVRVAQLATQQDLYRVDVRVLWPRGNSNDPARALPAGGICDTSVALANAPSPLTYHAIYVTTAVRGNPL